MSRLAFRGRIYRVTRELLVETCHIFTNDKALLDTIYEVKSRVSETSFETFLMAVEGDNIGRIGPEALFHLGSLAQEFQFVELGRRISEFLLRNPDIDIILLKSAIADLERRLAAQDRELRQLTETNAAEQNSQIEGLQRAIDEVSNKQQQECEYVLTLYGWMEDMRRYIDQTNEALERRIGPLEQAALGQVKTEDRTSRIESDVRSLRAAMADGGAKLEGVRREVAGLKAPLSDCCSELDRAWAHLQHDLATLKEEREELRSLKRAMEHEGVRYELENRNLKRTVESQRKEIDTQRKSQQRETEAVAEVPQLKRRIEALEQANRRLSDANEAVEREIRQVSNCCQKLNQDLANVERELATPKQEIRATKPKAEPLAPDRRQPPPIRGMVGTLVTVAVSRGLAFASGLFKR